MLLMKKKPPCCPRAKARIQGVTRCYKSPARIMCTVGGLGRHIGRYIGRLWTDYRSTIDRLQVDYRSIVDRQIGRQWTDISADSRLINVHISADASADSRPIYRSTIGRLSTDKCVQSTDKCAHISGYIGRLLVDISVDYRSTVDRLSTDSRPIVDRYIDRYIGRYIDLGHLQYT